MVNQKGVWSRFKGLFLAEQTSAVQLEGPKKITVQYEGQGSSGVLNFGGYYSEDYLNTLQGRQRADFFDKMKRSDPKIKMLLSAVKNPIKAATWKIEPADDSDLQKEIADKLNHIFFEDMDKSWTAFIHECLSMIEQGYVCFEIIDKVIIGHPKYGNYNGLQSLAFRSQRTIERFNLDPATGKLLSVSQYAFGDLQRLVEIKSDYLLMMALDKEGDNYEGISWLRPCVGAFKRKDHHLKIEAIGLEKYAIPTPYLKVPATKENSDEYYTAIEVMKRYVTHEQQFITYPDGWEIGFLQNDFDPSKVRSAIDKDNVEMVHAFLANFLELGQSGSGSYALSFDLSDFFLSAIEHIGNFIAEEINRSLIPRMVKLNYGPQDVYPKLRCTGITDAAGKEFAEVLKLLAEMKIIIPDDALEDEVRNRFKLSKKSDQGQREVASSQITQIKEGASGGANAIGANLPGSPAAPGQDVNVQQLALNGAQVTALIGLLKEVAIGGLPRDVAVNILIDAFNIDPVRADRIVGKIGKGFVPSQESLQQVSKFAESTVLKLSDPKTQITADRDALIAYMQSELKKISDESVATIVTKFKALKPEARLNAIKELPAPSDKEYSAGLLAKLSSIALRSLDQARTEVPKKKDVKLTERLASITLSDFDKLPKGLQTRIKAQSDLIVGTQIADLEKNLAFKYTSRFDSAEDASMLEADLNEAGATFLQSPSVLTGAGNIASQVVNEARNAFFLDPEVASEIESFTFTNGDPVSPICQDLAGTVFAKDDPNLDRYWPPLHHNCKSYIVPNLVGGKNEPISEGGLTPSDASLDKFMTLMEPNESFRVQAITIGKKLVKSMEEAKAIAMDYRCDVTKPEELEESYKFVNLDSSLFSDGTMKTFCPMEGVTVFIGLLKPGPV